MPDFVLAQVMNTLQVDPIDIATMPYPGSSKSKNFIKGLRKESPLGDIIAELKYEALKEMELKGVDISLSGYSDGDYWDLIVQSRIYQKETIPDSTPIGTVLTWQLTTEYLTQASEVIVYIGSELIDPGCYEVDVATKTITYEVAEKLTALNVLIITDYIIAENIICESIYTKEIAEYLTFLPVYPIKPGDIVNLIYHNTGSPKTIWANFKFLV